MPCSMRSTVSQATNEPQARAKPTEETSESGQRNPTLKNASAAPAKRATAIADDMPDIVDVVVQMAERTRSRTKPSHLRSRLPSRRKRIQATISTRWPAGRGAGGKLQKHPPRPCRPSAALAAGVRGDLSAGEHQRLFCAFASRRPGLKWRRRRWDHQTSQATAILDGVVSHLTVIDARHGFAGQRLDLVSAHSARGPAFVLVRLHDGRRRSIRRSVTDLAAAPAEGVMVRLFMRKRHKQILKTHSLNRIRRRAGLGKHYEEVEFVWIKRHYPDSCIIGCERTSQSCHGGPPLPPKMFAHPTSYVDRQISRLTRAVARA